MVSGCGQLCVKVVDGLGTSHGHFTGSLPVLAIGRPVECNVSIGIVIIEQLALHLDVGEVLGIDLGLIVVLSELLPVHGSALEAFVAALCLGALVKPSLNVAVVVDKDELCVVILAGAVEVGHAAIVARQIEVPTSNVVDSRVVGCEVVVLIHADLDFA